MAVSQPNWQSRAVSPVVATILMVSVVVVISASLAAVTFGFSSELQEPEEIRFMGDTEVLLGVEFRSWDGENGHAESGESNADIDHITIQYDHGPGFEGDEIGSVRIAWENASGQQGELEFINPNVFDGSATQQFHNESVGEFSTGNLRAGDSLTIRMAHNRYDKDQGETSQNELDGARVQYVESQQNDIALSDGSAFFRTSGRYPIQFSGDRPIKEGDDVAITFLGPDDSEIVAQTTAPATAFGSDAEPLTPSDLGK